MKALRLHLTLLTIFLTGNYMAQPLSGIQPKEAAFEYSQTPVFKWNSIDNVIDYTVLLSQDPSFDGIDVQSPALLITSWQSTSLAFGVWYWKVQANIPSGTVESEVNQITVFNPLQDPNLSLWLKADAGLTLDGFGNVQTWTDLSPNAFPMNQSNSVKRPGVVASSLNNLPSLSFSGSQFLDGGDVLDIGTLSRSMFVVGKMGASNQTLFSKTLAAFASSRYGLLKDGTQTAFIYQEGASQHIYSPFNFTNFSLYSIVSSRTAAKNKMEVNNTFLGQNTLNPGFDMSSNYRFLIGAYNNATNNGELLLLNGNISEIVFINSADSSQILKIENYLRYKYAPPIDLGSDTTVNKFCPINLAYTGSFTNVSWSTGATTSTISVDQSGTYWVQGTDIFGYVSRDTIEVYYPVIPTPSFSGICVGESMIWNANMGPGYTYLWSTSETTPSISISAPGTYSVEVFDGFGCSRNSGLYTFNLDTYSQTAYLGNDTSLCSGNLIALQVGASETVSYLWPDGSTGTDYAVDTTGNYFVESVNFNGCVARDTIFITVSGTAPIADFSFENQCLGVATDFIDQSVAIGLDNIVLWEWDMGDGTQLTGQNQTYALNATGSDTFTVQLYVESIGGCGAFHTETVIVHQNPTADFGFTGHCQSQEVEFSDLSTAGDTTITSYLWNFDMPWTGSFNTSTAPEPSRDFDSVLTYDVNLIITDGFGCQSTVTHAVQIDPSPEADFSFNDGCEDASIQFTNTSTTINPSTYLWNFGDATSSILPSPTKTYTLYGDYSVTLDVTNSFNCTSQKQEVIHIYAVPVAAISHGPICSGSYVELTSNSTIAQGSINTYIWEVNNSDTLYGNPVKYLVTSLGQQEFELTVSSDHGCTASALQFVDVTVELNASFSVGSGIVSSGVPFQFENTSTNASVTLWNFDDGQFSSDYSPSHTYGEEWTDSTLTPYLIVLNSSGCIDTAFQTIHIARELLDLELSNLFLQADGEQFIVGVKMVNVGTVSIEKVDFQMQDVKGFIFSEEWEGNLIPNEELIYLFNGKPGTYFSDQNGTEAFICVYGTAFDALNNRETLLENNVVCKNIEGSKVVLLPINPNPAKDQIEIGLVISETSNVQVDLVDANGKIVKELIPSQEYEIGTYFFDVDIRLIESGMYQVSLRTDDLTENRKLLISNY